MSRSRVSAKEFTGWWLRLRRESLGFDRAFLARRSAARGAPRITRTLLIDLELGRRQPNLRTLPQLASALDLPGEILASLVLASERIAADLERGILFGPLEEEISLLRRAQGALLGARFGRAFALAEIAAMEAQQDDEGRRAARLAAASAALGLGAPVLACWRARPVYEESPAESTRASAALVFARAAWVRGQARLTRAWLDQAKGASAPLDGAWRSLLEGRLAHRERRFDRARAALMHAHEVALVAGSAWLASEAAGALADALETLKRPDLAQRWRHRHGLPGIQDPSRPAHKDRKTFG